MSNLLVAETERRQTFRDEIVGQLPFDLIGIGMDETLPSVEISVSRAEGTNSHYYDTLENHDISDLLRNLAPNDNEAVLRPVRSQENLEGLVGKIDALETGFTDLVERSLFSPSKQAASGKLFDDPDTVHAPSVVHLGEHHERIAPPRTRPISKRDCRAPCARRPAQRRAEQARAIHALGRRAALGNHRSVHQTSLRTTRKPPPKSQLDLSDPTRAIEALRSFDHAGPATSKPSATRSASGRNNPTGTASTPGARLRFGILRRGL